MSYSEKEYWLRIEDSLKVIHSCGGCGKKQIFINTNNFRVNANGSKLDVWLIYQCEICRHTLNIPVFERIKSSKIDVSLYNRLINNDLQLAKKYGSDSAFFKAGNYEVDINSALIGLYDANGKPDSSVNNISYSRIIVHNVSGIKLRSEKIVSMILGISRSKAKKMIDIGQIRTVAEYNKLIIDFTNI